MRCVIQLLILFICMIMVYMMCYYIWGFFFYSIPSDDIIIICAVDFASEKKTRSDRK